VVAAVAIIAFIALDLRGGSPVEDAVAAVNKAVAVTAASAERSGAAAVRITHKGEPWAGGTIRWNGDDLALANDMPDRQGRVGVGFLLVDGMMYGREDEGWVELGSPDSIDPDTGTTPDEYLAAVRDDVGGVTLRRVTVGMTGLTSTELDDGSTAYRGAVRANVIARETGFKEGESIRVLPFGYVAHGRAEEPSALLDAALTVGADGVVREINVTWPGWSYTVSYSGLGETPAPTAPENAKPLRR
jgi:hypothetical protein